MRAAEAPERAEARGARARPAPPRTPAQSRVDGQSVVEAARRPRRGASSRRPQPAPRRGPGPLPPARCVGERRAGVRVADRGASSSAPSTARPPRRASTDAAEEFSGDVVGDGATPSAASRRVDARARAASVAARSGTRVEYAVAGHAAHAARTHVAYVEIARRGSRRTARPRAPGQDGLLGGSSAVAYGGLAYARAKATANRSRRRAPRARRPLRCARARAHLCSLTPGPLLRRRRSTQFRR